MTKQRSPVWLLFLLIAAMLAAPAAAAAEIQYLAWGSEQNLAAHERMAKVWLEKYGDTGITIDARVAPWEGYHDSLYVMAAAGVLPDIVVVSSSYWPDMAAQGFFLDIEPFIERDSDFDVNELPPNILENMRVRGHIYALPQSALAPSGAMVNFNLDMLDAAGLVLPPFDWTWDDYLDYARKLTRSRSGSEIDQWGSNLGKSTWEAGWAMLIGSNGGHIVDPQGGPIIMPVLDPTRLRVNTPVFAEGFQFLNDLVDVYNVSVPSSIRNPFDAGVLAMETTWSGTLRNRLLMDDKRVGGATSPRGSAGHHGIYPSVGIPHVMAISAQTKDPEAAWAVLKFIFQDEDALRARGLDGSHSISTRSLLPVYEQLLDPRQRPWLEIGFYYIENTPAVGNELHRTVPAQVLEPLREEIQKAYNGEQDIRSALENAERQMAAIMRDLAAAHAR